MVRLADGNVIESQMIERYHLAGLNGAQRKQRVWDKSLSVG